MTAPASLVVNVGQSIQLQARVLDRAGTPIANAPIAFQSDTPETATVTAAGQVAGISAGAATIRLTSGDAFLLVAVTVTNVTATGAGITDDGAIVVVRRGAQANRFQANQQGSDDIIFATNTRRHVIRRGTFAQGLSDFAGLADTPGNTDGGVAAARYNGPLGLSVAEDRRALFVADTINQAVRRVDLDSNRVTTFITAADLPAPATGNWGPRGVVEINDDLFITDTVNHVVWRARTSDGRPQVSLFAGAVAQPGNTNGVGTEARFNGPQEIVRGQGNLLVVIDRLNRLARLISVPDATVTTLGRATGSPTVAADPSAGNRIIAPNQSSPVIFSDPFGVATDEQGNIYVADGNTVRVVTPQGSTVIAQTDLAQTGTFQRAVGVSISNNAAFVLDVGRGQVVRVGLAVPTITSLSRAQITVGEAPEIVATGTNFTPETQVRIGNQSAAGVGVEASTRVRFRVPPQQRTGQVTVTVSTRGGTAQATLTVVDAPAPVGVPRVRFGDAVAAPGTRAEVPVFIDIPDGVQPGIVTLDIPLDPSRIDLARVSAMPGSLPQYSPGDLLVGPLPTGGIRVVLVSSASPAAARLAVGTVRLCTLSIPISASAPGGAIQIGAATQGTATSLNRSLADGGTRLQATFAPGTLTVGR